MKEICAMLGIEIARIDTASEEVVSMVNIKWEENYYD